MDEEAIFGVIFRIIVPKSSEINCTVAVVDAASTIAQASLGANLHEETVAR
jgi:hypothetical protein